MGRVNKQAWKNMREVSIIGVGLHKFGRWPDKSPGDLGRVAIQEALDDAGVEFKDIQAGWSGRVNNITGTGPALFGELGQPGILIDNVEKACASSSTAIRLATWAVGAGLYDVVLCTGVEKMQRGLVTAGGGGGDILSAPYAYQMGMYLMPAEYAMQAQRHMAEFGSTPEQFAQVAVKSHKNALMNPYAQYQIDIDLDDVMNAPMIADPITRYMCSPSTDGASAAVICAKEVAVDRYKGKPVTIAGWSSGTPEYNPKSVGDDVAVDFVARLAEEAYDLADVKPEDVKVAQVHDAFAPGEVFAIEALGFCGKGEGAQYVWDGKADIDGEHPVNTDGGLESRGHPMGATGIAQIIEIVRQLRGEAGQRQVPGDFEYGVTHNVGIGGANITVLKK